MSAALRVAHAAETIRARWERRTVESPQVEAAQALEDTGQLLDPEVAAELKRLRVRATALDYQGPGEHETVEEAAQMYRGLRPVIERTMVEPDRWDGDEDESFHLGRYVEWLASRVAELEAERHSTNEALDDTVQELRRRETGPALPWAHTMSDHDLHGFLDDLVSAAMGRWRSEPEIPDRTVLADIEKACAEWRTPGKGHRLDGSEFDGAVVRLAPSQAAEGGPVALPVEDAEDLTTLAPVQEANARYNPTFRTIELDLTATKEQWAAWQKALDVDLARTTNRGGLVTSHAKWRGISVVIRCWFAEGGTE